MRIGMSLSGKNAGAEDKFNSVTDFPVSFVVPHSATMLLLTSSGSNPTEIETEHAPGSSLLLDPWIL